MGTTAKARVRRGAAVLDEKKPHWFRRLDLEKLDIRSNSDCVIGQLSKGDCYKYLDRTLGLKEGQEVSHGFMADDRVGDEELTALWKAEILARRPAKKAKAVPAEDEPVAKKKSKKKAAKG